MWCSTCLADLALDQFSNSQKKRSASARKCSACVAAPARADGGGLVAGQPDMTSARRCYRVERLDFAFQHFVAAANFNRYLFFTMNR